MRVEKGTIIRTILLVVALVNQALVISGKNTLPFSEEQMTEFLSMVFTGVTAISAWWKNNSFTKEAIIGDNTKNALKSGDIVEADLDNEDEDMEVVVEPKKETLKGQKATK